MGSSKVEICSKCGREIPKSEQACVFSGEIVCVECNSRLRSHSQLPRPSAGLQQRASSPRRVDEEETANRAFRTGRRSLLVFTGTAFVLVLAVCTATYLFFLDTERPDAGRARTIVPDPQTTQPERVDWPFTAKIPKGFEFDRLEKWKGRTFWILKGKQFGQACETLIVVRADPNLLADDVLRAPYWTAELCVGLSVGESFLSQRDVNEQEYTFLFFPQADNQILLSPLDKKKPVKTVSPEVRGFPRIPDIPDLSPPQIPLEDLGRSADFVPCSISAWVGLCEGTVLITAWAGDSNDWTPGGCRVGDLLELCRSLRQEQAFKAPDNLRKSLRLEHVKSEVLLPAHSKVEAPSEEGRTVQPPKANNVIVVVEYPKRPDLVPVQAHFAEYGIATEIVNWGGKYFLITKDRYESFGPNSDGYKTEQKIIEVGAKYKGKAPEGYETFAPDFFRNAYDKKFE